MNLTTERRPVDTEWLGQRMLQRPKTPPLIQDGIKLTVNTVPAGQPHQVVSLRNAIFMGQEPTTVAFDVDLEIRHLGYEGGEWMADSCQEVWQMHEALEALREMDEPELLVGGLGLGVFSHLADQYSGAIVTTVEKDQRIIDAVAPHTARIVHQGDIYEHCRHWAGDYHAAFLDTWQRTGEYAWIREVVPLRRIIGDQIPAENIWCWNEDEMTGQIRLSGPRAMCIPMSSIPPSSTHWVVLRAKAEQIGIAPTVDMSDTQGRAIEVQERAAELWEDPVAHQVLERFLRAPGSPEWEAEFGQLWDDAEARAAAWREEHGLED